MIITDLNQDPNNLWKRYGVALVIILAFLGASHFIETQAIAKAKQDAAVINLSGKQRMLSQQILLHAQDYVSYGDVEALEKLTLRLEEFESAHHTLMEDASSEESLGRLYLSRTPSTDEMILNYISVARQIPMSEYPRARLAELKFAGSGEVLQRLDEAVSAFEQRVKKQADWAHQLQNITMAVAVFVLVLEALIIFLPAHRLVQRSIRELKRAVETDALTQLKNRAGFEKDLNAAKNHDNADKTALTLVLLDLDDFKGINDRHGHTTGDAVLRRVGHRISKLPNLVSAARVGGDEFAILVDNQHWDRDERLERIVTDVATARDMIYRPINYRGRVIKVSGSVGISRYPIDAKNLGDLRRNASAALLDAKRQGRGSLSVFDMRMKDTMHRRRAIQSALLSNGYQDDLSVVFQPIVDPGSEKIKSVEALARWQHPKLGPINPIEFLEIAKESGVGLVVERRLRFMALTEMRPFLQHKQIESISLNVSPLELAAEDFVRTFIQQIEDRDIRPDQIWIEVTESEKLRDIEVTKANLEQISRTGVRIALDDYGVGYSNIQRLAELPIDRVKIDKSIVQNVELAPKYAGVCRSSVQLARALGADVVAEGVETAEQLNEIQSMGCDLVQGYYYFKPMTLAEFRGVFGNNAIAAA
ncbi:MAG: EAL domain-containing protein [Pseudomonadota bacterium]